MNCLSKLVSLKSECNAGSTLFYLDDAEGISETMLAQIAGVRAHSGKNQAIEIIESAARIMSADVEGLIPSRYRIQTNLAQICNSNKFSFFTAPASASGTGIIVKNTSVSGFSKLSIDELTIRTTSAGTFTLKITDGKSVREIPLVFDGTNDLKVSGVAYTTTEKSVKIYFDNPDISLSMIEPNSSDGCGCGSANAATKNSVVIGGLHNGIEGPSQYGILPCATVSCSPERVICQLVEHAPRLAGLALFYLSASKVFELATSTEERINRSASFRKESKKDMAAYYYRLYRERLSGDTRNNILGLTQSISSILSGMRDACVVCESPVGVAWAVG